MDMPKIIVFSHYNCNKINSYNYNVIIYMTKFYQNYCYRIIIMQIGVTVNF